MHSLAQRYLDGKSAAVVEILRQAGPLHGEIATQAEEVADLILDRCQKNMETIAGRLSELGYLFARSQGPFSESTPESDERLEELQKRWGVFPLLIRKWYERFAFVDFCQHEQQIHEDGPLRGLGSYPQLLTLPLEEVEAHWEECEKDHEDHVRFMTDVMEQRGETYTPSERQIELRPGPYGSNCAPKAFPLPSAEFDPEFYNEGAGPMTFYDDLQTIFRFGGFPHLAVYMRHQGLREAMGMPDPEAIKLRLAEGLSDV